MFENYIRNARTNRYILICSIDAHEKQHPTYVDDGSIRIDDALTSNSTTQVLDSLGETFDFVDCWLKGFDENYQDWSNVYGQTMQDLFLKYYFNLLNHLVIRRNADHY